MGRNINSSTRSEAFSRWDLLGDDNIDLKQIKIRFFDMPDKLIIASDSLDDYSRLFLLSLNLQMVIGGLKPATFLEVNHSLIDDYISAGLIEGFSMDEFTKIMFDIFNIRIQPEPQSFNKEITNYIAYNSEMLTQLVSKHRGLQKYLDTDIFEWMNENINAGFTKNFIDGIVFGVPTSAVKQYDKYQTDEQCRYEGRRRVSSYGEEYYVWGNELKRDVAIRETMKETFFMNLAHHLVYLNLMKDLHKRAEPFRAVSKVHFEKSLFNFTA